jgi:hypothetical protein
MPRVRETRLQIKEQTEREIRNRTAVRIAQLYTDAEAEEERKEGKGNEVGCNIVRKDRIQEGRLVECERCRRFDLVLTDCFLYFLWC